MKFRLSRWLAVMAALLIAAGAVAWPAWRARVRHSALLAALPPRPECRAFPEAFSQRLATAEARVRVGPDRLAALAELARLYHANGFFDEAARAYRALLDAEPHNPRWPHLLASILASYGQGDEARPLLERTVALAPQYLPARLRLAETLLKQNQLAAAAAAYGEALEREPGQAYALLGLARCAVAENRWPVAQQRLEQLARIHPDFGQGWKLLATVYAESGNEPAAARARARGDAASRFCAAPDPWLDELMRECYDPYRLGIQAETLMRTGRHSEALELFERALTLAPDDASLHRQLAALFTERKQPAQTRAHLERAVALAPRDADNWLALVVALRRAGDVEAFDRALAAGLKNCPDAIGLLYERGNRLAAAGQLDAALAAFQEIRRLQPNEAEIAVAMAELYLRLNRGDDAARELNAALAAAPENPPALILLARRTIAAGSEIDARDLLRRVRRQTRVPPRDLQELERLFQERFGRPAS